MKLTFTGDDGTAVDFECANTLASRWVARDILAGKTYPFLPFVDDVQVVFDVGANCGATTVHFSRHYPDAEIHSFEPGSEPRAFLELNAAERPNVHVHPIGLFSVDEVVPLYKGNGDSGMSSVFPRGVNLDDSEPVHLRRGDEFAAEHAIDRVDVLKIDVEGCEIGVLEGLARFLPSLKVLYVEYDTRQARRDIEAMFEATHELYTGMVFLDQGECVYVRKDLAERPEASEFLRELVRVRWTEAAGSS